VPEVPATPNGSFPIAEVLVQATVTAITTGDITDRRWEAPVRGQLVETVYFTSSGSFVKADYPWLDKVRAKVQAGGGAGGGAAATGVGEGSGGSGGGGGEYREGVIDALALSASETVTRGAGAAGGAGAGATGGTSSFGSHISAIGGSGGLVFAAGTTFAGQLGGPGGTGGSGGDLANPGGPGSACYRIVDGAVGRALGIGDGGDSTLGHGGQGQSVVASAAGRLYGGGGGGTFNGASSSADNGGDGADGIVILELYA
jgi:hypothetical protein